MNKFQRQYIFTATTKQGELVTIQNPFTIHFNIVRHQLSSAAHANLKIYNLAHDTRMKLLKNNFTTNSDWYFPIQLRAGYPGIMATVLRGGIMEGRSYRAEGSADFITELDIYDGGFDIAHSDSNFAVGPGTLRIDAIKSLCNDLKNCKIGAIGSFPGSYGTQRLFVGRTMQLIQQETGGNVFIDNEHIYCIRDTEAFEDVVPLISSATGMLGSPVRTQGLICVEMVFEPRMKVGQIVELISEDDPALNQVYKVVAVQHSGTISDSVGGKLKTVVRLTYGNQNFDIVEARQYV